MQILFLIILLLVLSPFLALSFFCFPSADDFTAYLANGFWEAQKYWYMNWTGRFSGVALVSVGPANYGSIIGYQISSFFEICAVFASSWFLVRSIIGFGISRVQVVICSLVFLGLCIYKMPSVASAFYWYNGYMFYTTSIILLSLGVGIFLRSNGWSLTKDKPSWFYMNKKWSMGILSALLMILPGTNEICIPISCILVCSGFVFYYLENKSMNRHLIIPALSLFVAVLVSILAPGNSTRAALNPQGHNLISAIYYSCVIGLELAFSYFSIPLLVAFVAGIPFVLSLKEKVNPRFFNKTNRYLFLLGFYFSCATFLFPSYWALDIRPPYRALNILVFIHVTFMFLIYFQNVLFYSEKTDAFFKSLSKGLRNALPIMFILSLFVGENIRTAWTDLLFKAEQYSADQVSRRELALSSEGEDLVLPSFKVVPQTVFFDDLEEDSNNWKNMAYAQFYKLKSVRTSK